MWKKSNFIDGAIFREDNDFVEIYEIVPYFGRHTGYTIAHGLLNFNEINLKEVMEVFDCVSLSQLKEYLGMDWKQDAILAWFDMTCKNNEDAYRVRRVPFSSYDEALQQMHQIVGNMKDSGKEALEISRVLVISTAHISYKTAKLMDMDAISFGLNSVGDSGYNILIVGWDEYIDMPQDLKNCMKFAAENDCDWLYLDNDAHIVPRLIVYEWPN